MLTSLIVVTSALAAAEPLCAEKESREVSLPRVERNTLVGAPSAVDPLGRGLWVIDEENDAVSLVLPTGTSRRFQVGRWPQQLVAASSGRIFVTSRQDGRVDVIDPDFRQQQIAIGDEPRALALDEDHGRLYVALVTEKAVVAIDIRQLRAVGRIEVPDAPVAIAVTARTVIVASDRSRAVRLYDLQLKAQTGQLDLPAQRAATLSARLLVPAGDGVLLIAERARTGLDQPVSFGGYGGDQSESEPIDTLLFSLGNPDEGYAPVAVLAAIHANEPVAAFFRESVLYVASRGRSAVIAIGLTPETGAFSSPVELRPALWPVVEETLSQNGELRRFLNPDGETIALEADLTGAVADDQGRLVATDALGRRLIYLAANTTRTYSQFLGRRFGGTPLKQAGNVRLLQQIFGGIDAGGGFNNAFGGLGGQMGLGIGGLGSIGTPGLRSMRRRNFEGFTAPRQPPFNPVPPGPVAMGAIDAPQAPVLVHHLGPGRDVELRVGQRLFHTTKDFRISGHGVACASCHPDGREDGRVWSLMGTRRQTPMLAARLHDTAPFNWLGSAKTLEGNLTQTMVDRLEGEGLMGRDLKALTRFVRDGLRPVSQPAPKEPELVAEGREIFHDAKVGCAACHPSDFATTDGERHDVGSLSALERTEFRTAHPPQIRRFDRKTVQTLMPLEKLLKLPVATGVALPLEVAPRQFDTPSLKAVALTAPYFHDGAAGSLEELIAQNDDRMGMTSHLDETQRRALVAYLQTL